MNPNQPQDPESPDQGQPVQPVSPAPPAPVGSAPGAVNQQDLQNMLSEEQSATPVSEQAVATEESAGNVDESEQFENQETDLDQPVSWTAHEFIHQEKGAGWFMLFIVVCLAFAGFSVWMQAWSFTALIAVIAFIVIVYLRRPPRELTYSLSNDGLTIDGKIYKYDSFKSFGVVEDGDQFSIMLIPTQRFQQALTVYFPEEVGEDIVDILGERMPMKDLKLDAVDRLVRMLRL